MLSRKLAALAALLLTLGSVLGPIAALARVPWGTAWYVDGGNGTSTGYWTTAQWAATHAYVAGNLVRQLAAPGGGNERIMVEYVASCTSGSTEPTWSLTLGGLTTTDGTCKWADVDGQAGVNNDTVNAPTWLTSKNAAVPTGVVIFDSVTSSLQVVTVAGTEGNGSAPSFSATAGTNTTDNTVTWTSLGLASNFTKWLAPQAHLAITSGDAGACDNVYVATEETTEACIAAACSQPTFTAAGTVNCPVSIISVNKAGNVPPQGSDFAVGAVVGSTVGTNYSLAATTGGGAALFNGIYFNPGAQFTIGGNSTNFFSISNSHIVMLDAAAVNIWIGGNAAWHTVWNNVTVKFAQGQQTLTTIGSSFPGSFEWHNTPSAIDATGTIPTALFNSGGAGMGTKTQIAIDAVDLSAMTTKLFDAITSGNCYDATVTDSKIASGVAVVGTVGSVDCGTVSLVNVDSGATGWRNEFYAWAGTVTTDTTTTLIGGTTVAGQSVAQKFTTTANTTVAHPLVGPWICAPSSFTSGTHTVTVQIAGATSLNNNDMWMYVRYPGSSSSPLGSYVSTGLSNPLSTNAAIPSSTAAWNGSPAVKQQMQALFSPLAAGKVCVQPVLAKPSTVEDLDWTLILL